MTQRRIDREALGLSQGDAAVRAGVSMATWRRWEQDPAQVGSASRAACERVLDRQGALAADLTQLAGQYERAWGECPDLTPRQAYALASSLHAFADIHLGEWLRRPGVELLHDVPPLDALDLRVMILVNENRAWAESLSQRCHAVGDEIAQGVLPFDRPGCFADELLVALALPHAEASMSDMPGLFEQVAPRSEQRAPRDGDEDADWVLDDEWGLVADLFDNRCRWDEWDVPTVPGHPLLAAILAEHHPYTWFDPGEGTGAGYLQMLSGQAVWQGRGNAPDATSN